MKPRTLSHLFFSLSVIVSFLGLGALRFTAVPYAQKPQKDSIEMENHSFAREAEAVVKHLELELIVDFLNKRLSGVATLYFNNKTGTDKLYLDTRDLTIKNVYLDTARKEKADFSLGESVPNLGQPLIVNIESETKAVVIHYETDPKAAALQWLEPEQTAGKKKPFLFTQSQAILARTWVPCQDNPGVRMTYRAKIKTPPGMLAVMSAENDTTRNPKGLYEFYMPQPIPSYLLALAVGDIEFRQISERFGVFAEPAVVDKAAWEFADTEKMIVAAEELYGPYRWGRYDIIVLPPSFPFGGMENPRLTFATPTVLTGDRSLVGLVAHELAHSWSGNLVTNATWNDFWLNEGFTVYFERRIIEALYGKEYATMRAALGYQDLLKEIKDLGAASPDTKLYLDLKGRDPDDAVTRIPYEKGYFFLRTIEQSVGRNTWDMFLRGYFEKYAFQSMTTEGFLNYLEDQLIMGDTTLSGKLQIEEWVYTPGLPTNFEGVYSNALANVDTELQRWEGGTSPIELQTSRWNTHQWLHFLRNLPSGLTRQQMSELDRAFGFTRSANSEILSQWFLQVIARKYETAYPALEAFLTEVGRRKFLKPLYTEMAKSPEGMLMAKHIYQRARPGYHAVTANTIDKILKWKQ